MALELRRRNTFIICMTTHADQHVLAYMLYSIHSLAAHIARLAVCPLHRRAGHAKRLIQHVTRELQRARRISTFSLHVAAVNEPALALYKASGFKEDAFLQDYYAPGRHAHRCSRRSWMCWAGAALRAV
ncbi:putative N-acetyltransferase [Auxenochlorella protothecoides]|uniref:Putative N-acetyltransferase n=1 Tax=Auxenochlorella protothecoides TaxID=3075 RepID=A0A087SSJ6_AUXPR|nr:putative N-acetyltransferase [Auxenochlorella protothecoides]KFM28700.1 putative N-acetyltransferase [Auxenochlorella protothecoides]